MTLAQQIEEEEQRLAKNSLDRLATAIEIIDAEVALICIGDSLVVNGAHLMESANEPKPN